MKVDLNHYEVPVRSLLKKRKASSKLYDEILEIINGYLPCSECKELLPVDNFAMATANVNRNHRFTICKECCKKMRKGGQGA